MNYYTDVFKKYAVFNGRAGRKEYWLFMLFNALIAWTIFIVLAVIGNFIGIPALKYFEYVYALVILIPGLAVTVRRLHDTNHSAWRLMWIFLAPVITVLLSVIIITSVVVTSLMLLTPTMAIAALIIYGILAVINLVIAIQFLVFLCLDSNPVENKYGIVPQKTISSPLQRLGIAILIIIAIILAVIVGFLNYKSPVIHINNQQPRSYSEMSIADCIKIQNVDDRTTCFNFSINANKNPNTDMCDAVPNDLQCTTSSSDFKPIDITCQQLCLNRVYGREAELQKNASLCEQITILSDKNSCYDGVAGATKDYSYCAKIENDDTLKDICLSDTAQAAKNATGCGGIINSSQKSLCYDNIAYNTNDFSVCVKADNTTRNDCLGQFLAWTKVKMAKSPAFIDSTKLPSDLLAKVCPLYIPTALGKYDGQSDCINEFTSPPTLSVTAPNSGTFSKNEQIAIKWTTGNISDTGDTVSIDLQSQDSKFICHVTYVNESLAGPGSYNFIPANTTCGDVPGNYRINMSVEVIGGLTKDALGGWFTIK
jgi:uncharacterized membrane protein YhaH (DUF805 family)